MRATVLNDPALAKQAGRFVWLSIDTENEKNAAFLEKYPVDGVPTFGVIDPATEKTVYYWLGAVDRPTLETRLDEAQRAYADASDEPKLPSSADSEILELSRQGKNAECAERSRAELATLPDGGVKASVAALGLDCALSLDDKSGVPEFESAVRKAIGYDGLLDDDRSALYGSLVDARDRQGDDAGAKAAARDWLDWLEVQAREAKNVEARAALDGHRVSAALEAGTPERAVPALELSARELPGDYNPQARLAILYRETGRLDDALVAVDRALGTAYGPRKVGIYETKISILQKKDERERAGAVIDEALAYANSLPEPQRSKRRIARLETMRDELGKN